MVEGAGPMAEGAGPMEVNTSSPARKSSGSMKHTGAFAGAPYRVDKKKTAERFIEAVRAAPEHAALAADAEWCARARSFFRDMPKQYVMDVSIDTPDAVLKHMELVAEVLAACRE